MHTIKNSKKLLSFVLKNTERFDLADKTPATHENFFTFEVLGRNAELYLSMLVPGEYYQVDGYLRRDLINGEEKIRIRCYNVQSVF